MRVVVDEQLGDRVDEMIGLRRAEAVEHRGLRAFAQRHERVRERGAAVALAPVQHEDRILDDDARGNVHERAAGEEGVVQDRERVFGRARRAPEQLADEVVLARRDAAGAHALGLERGIELVVHDPAVAHDDHARVLARLRGPRTAAGRALVAGRAELLGRERAVAIEIELVDARVAPDLLRRRRPRDLGESFDRREPPLRPTSPGRRARAPRRP